MSITDGQLEYNGYVLGDDENTFMISISGWDDLPGVDSANSLRPSAHGAWAGHKYASQRIITWEGRFAPLPDNWTSEIKSMRNAFTIPPDHNEQIIYIRTRDETLIAYGSVVARAMPGDYDYSNYGAKLTLQFECSDPRRYSSTEFSSVIALSVSPDQGLMYPLVYPLDYGDPPTPSIGTLLNDGNMDTPLTINIYGPLENPKIINQTTGRKLDFAIPLTSTDYLVIDTRKGSVLLNGVADRIYTRSLSSSPILSFNLAAGDNNMRILADSWDVGASVDFSWRSAIL